MRSSFEVRSEMDQVTEQDYSQQWRHLERLVAESDALDDEELSGDIRGHLLSAYAHGGAKSSLQFAPFAWLVQRFDDPPGWWAHRHDRTVLWAYKWLIGAAIRDTSVALTTLDQLVDGMADRYERRNAGAGPLLEARFKVRSHVHGADAAADAYVSWTRTPRSDYSDCLACEPTVKVRYLAEVDCHSEALEEFWPVHSGGLTCAEQPEAMYAVAIPSLLLQGESRVAATAHLQGTRLTRGSAAGASLDAEQLGHCARGGQLARGLDILEQRMGHIGSAQNDADELTLAANGALLLGRLASAGHNLEITLPDGTQADAVAGERILRERAVALAAAFDARNGTDAESARLHRLIDSDDLPPLELGAATPRLRTSAPSGTGADVVRPQATPHDVSDLDLTDPVALLATTEAALHAGELGRVEAITVAWLAAVPAAEPAAAASPEVAWAAAELDLAAMRNLEPDRLAVEDGQALGARAAGRLRAHGWEAEALMAEQAMLIERIGDSAGEDPALDDLRAEAFAHVARIDAVLAATPGAISPNISAVRLRSKARSRVVRIARDEDVRTQCLTEGLDLSADVGPTSDADARWGRAILLLSAADGADPATARGLARDLLTLLSDGLLPHLRCVAQLRLSSAALGIEEYDDALTHADEAFDLAIDLHQRGGDVRPGLQCVFHGMGPLARALPPDRSERVVELLARHLRLVQSLADRDVTPAVRLQLSGALRRSGRAVEAAECLELGLAELGEVDREHQYLDLHSLRLSLLVEAAETSLSLGETGRATTLTDQAVTAALDQDKLHVAVHAAELATRAADRVDDALAALASYRRLVELADRTLAEGSFGALQFALYGRREIGARTLATDGRDAAEQAFDHAVALVDEMAAHLAADEDDPRIQSPAERQYLVDMVAWEQPRLQQSRAQMLLAVEAYADALTTLAGLDRTFAGLDAWRDAVIVISLTAQAHAGLGDMATASTLWERAIQEAGTHDLVPLQASIANTWVWALDAAGDTERAQEIWARWVRQDD